MKDRFDLMWDAQGEYAKRLYDITMMNDAERELKTKELALSLHHEISKLVSAVNFKSHKRTLHPPDKGRILYESVDVVRYAYAICSLWGFKADDFAAAWSDKDESLDLMLTQDMNPWDGQLALIVDIDDVIADFREGFSEWVRDHKGIGADPNSNEFYFIEQLRDVGVSALELHDEFISHRKLASLPVNETVKAINKIHDAGIWIHLLTARPKDNLMCKYDTMKWLQDAGVKYDRLDFTGEKLAFVTRTPYCVEDKIIGCVDDSPMNCRAYMSHGLTCLMPLKSYNHDVISDSGKLIKYNNSDELYDILNRLIDERG